MTIPNRIYTDIDLSFEKITSNDIAKRVDVNAVKQSIKNLLMTQRGERLFQPEVGADLYQILFEPMDPLTTDALKDVIVECIKNFEPRVVLQGVDINPNYDRNEYDISLYFYVVGLVPLITYNLTLTRLR
jgi:phage baseplate assembly protein W